MEKFIYTKQQVDRILNLINTFTFTGISEASKIIEMVNILNNFEKDEEKEDDTVKFD